MKYEPPDNNAAPPSSGASVENQSSSRESTARAGSRLAAVLNWWRAEAIEREGEWLRRCALDTLAELLRRANSQYAELQPEPNARGDAT